MKSVANQKNQKTQKERKKDHKIFSMFCWIKTAFFVDKQNKRPFIFFFFVFLLFAVEHKRHERRAFVEAIGFCCWGTKSLDSKGFISTFFHYSLPSSTLRFRQVFLLFLSCFWVVVVFLLFCFFLQIDFSVKFVLVRYVWMLSPTPHHTWKCKTKHNKISSQIHWILNQNRQKIFDKFTSQNKTKNNKQQVTKTTKNNCQNHILLSFFMYFCWMTTNRLLLQFQKQNTTSRFWECLGKKKSKLGEQIPRVSTSFSFACWLKWTSSGPWKRSKLIIRTSFAKCSCFCCVELDFEVGFNLVKKCGCCFCLWLSEINKGKQNNKQEFYGCCLIVVVWLLLFESKLTTNTDNRVLKCVCCEKKFALTTTKAVIILPLVLSNLRNITKTRNSSNSSLKTSQTLPRNNNNTNPVVTPKVRNPQTVKKCKEGTSRTYWAGGVKWWRRGIQNCDSKQKKQKNKTKVDTRLVLIVPSIDLFCCSCFFVMKLVHFVHWFTVCFFVLRNTLFNNNPKQNKNKGKSEKKGKDQKKAIFRIFHNRNTDHCSSHEREKDQHDEPQFLQLLRLQQQRHDKTNKSQFFQITTCFWLFTTAKARTSFSEWRQEIDDADTPRETRRVCHSSNFAFIEFFCVAEVGRNLTNMTHVLLIIHCHVNNISFLINSKRFELCMQLFSFKLAINSFLNVTQNNKCCFWSSTSATCWSLLKANCEISTYGPSIVIHVTLLGVSPLSHSFLMTSRARSNLPTQEQASTTTLHILMKYFLFRKSSLDCHSCQASTEQSTRPSLDHTAWHVVNKSKLFQNLVSFFRSDKIFGLASPFPNLFDKVKRIGILCTL